jgi:hypothetical protein
VRKVRVEVEQAVLVHRYEMTIPERIELRISTLRAALALAVDGIVEVRHLQHMLAGLEAAKSDCVMEPAPTKTRRSKTAVGTPEPANDRGSRHVAAWTPERREKQAGYMRERRRRQAEDKARAAAAA